MPDKPNDVMTAEKANMLLESAIPPVNTLQQGLSSGVQHDQLDISPAEVQPDEHEAEASKHGWRPQTEFSGDPKTWLPAKEFLQQRPLIEKIRFQNKLIDQVQRRLQDAEARAIRAEQIGYQRAITELQYKKDAAVAEGNVAQVHEIDRQIDEHRNAQFQAQAQTQATVDPATMYLSDWLNKNTWFNTDESKPDDAVTAFAKSEHVRIQRTQPYLPMSEQLELVDKSLRQTYPEKFGVHRQASAPQVESNNGGAPPPSRSRRGLQVSDLSDDERNIMRNLIASGAKITEAEYLKQLEPFRNQQR